MNINILFSTLLLVAHSAYAVDDEAFQKCVLLKDLTITIAEKADQGVTRQQLKARLPSTSVHSLIDFVYDFRGAKSNQELAANQMESCLLISGAKRKKM